MSDLSTFARSKDWLIVALIGLLIAGAGGFISDNRNRIDKLEANQAEAARSIAAVQLELDRRSADGFQRLARVEESLGNLRSDILRRLDRIEEKLH